MKLKLSTYTLPRPFFGYNIPIAIQSSFMRDYANRSNYQFSLPVTELTTTNSYLMLRKIIRAKRDEPLNLAVCSGFVFPISNQNLLQSIFFSDDIKVDLSIHLVLEAKILDRKGIIEWSKSFTGISSLVSSYNELGQHPR